MAHEVILGLWKVLNSNETTPTVPIVNTASTGYSLRGLGLITPTTDPLNGRVVETLTIFVQGTSLADLRTKLAAIYDMADQVRRFELGQNPLFGRVSVQVGDTGNTYWSILHAMQVNVPESLLGVDYANEGVEVKITYERDGWWEKNALMDLTMTNPNGTATRLNIANCNDGTGSSPNKLANYVDIDTSDVDGDLPTPVFINVLNAENVSAGNLRIYAGGIGTRASEELPTLFYEAESGTGGSSTADATCSGGYKKTLTLSDGNENTLLKWAISNPDYYLGAWYKILARFAGTGSLGNVKFRWQLLSGTTVVWKGAQFLLENATNLIQEMGEAPLPPLPNWTGTLTLALTGQRTTSATETLTLDYIQLMAAHTTIKAAGLIPHEYNSIIEIPYREKLFPRIIRENSSGIFIDWYTEWNRAILVNPGQYYRIHFVIQSETGGTAEIDRNAMIAICCYPRYRGIGE